jgi:hypothetical protein
MAAEGENRGVVGAGGTILFFKITCQIYRRFSKYVLYICVQTSLQTGEALLFVRGDCSFSFCKL